MVFQGVFKEDFEGDFEGYFKGSSRGCLRGIGQVNVKSQSELDTGGCETGSPSCSPTDCFT